MREGVRHSGRYEYSTYAKHWTITAYFNIHLNYIFIMTFIDPGNGKHI